MTDWTVEQLARNVHRITFDKVKSGWEGWVMLRSDVHHDSPQSLTWLETDHLDLALERNAAIIDAGDLFDVMGGKGDKRRSEKGVRDRDKADDYFNSVIEEATDYYQPYAKQFAVFGYGNHETAVIRHHSIDPIKWLTDNLRYSGANCFTGGYGGYVILQFNVGGRRESLTIKYFHGSGGGGPVTKGVIKTNRHAVVWPDADIVHMGHIHEAWDVDIAQERINSKATQFKRVQRHICTPGYKDGYQDGAGGFEVEKDMPPKSAGCYWLHLTHRDRRRRGIQNIIKCTAIKDTEAL